MEDIGCGGDVGGQFGEGAEGGELGVSDSVVQPRLRMVLLAIEVVITENVYGLSTLTFSWST